MGWGEDFEDRTDSGKLVVGIVGMGYVGLPTAIGFYNAGFTVFGIDSSESVIASLLNGRNPTNEPTLEDKIPSSTDERWNITHSFTDSIPKCDVVFVSVPTPVTEERRIDAKFVREAGHSIFSNVRNDSNTIVILESTVYPGLTRSEWFPIVDEYGLKMGTDVEIAYCPERYNPGDPVHGINNVDRVIGSTNPLVGQSLVKLYSKLTSGGVHHVGSIEVAESSKLIENVQRDINIALVNELSMILPKLGVDIEEVLDAASTKWNFHRYTPGIGVGGHCIPVDPYFLIDQANERNSSLELISAAREINNHMPVFIAEEIVEILETAGVPKNGRRALIVGWSYKPQLGDSRGSPSKDLAEVLMSKGIEVSSWDPYVPKNQFSEGVSIVDEVTEVGGYDIVIIATAHEAIANFNWEEIAKNMRNPIIFDGRRCLDINHLSVMGWHVEAVGMPRNK